MRLKRIVRIRLTDLLQVKTALMVEALLPILYGVFGENEIEAEVRYASGITVYRFSASCIGYPDGRWSFLINNFEWVHNQTVVEKVGLTLETIGNQPIVLDSADFEEIKQFFLNKIAELKKFL